MNSSIIFAILTTLSLLACNDQVNNNSVLVHPMNDTLQITTYFLIRHSEKNTDSSGNSDPGLTTRGKERTKYWVSFLSETKINTIYTTNYKRTRQTAAPFEKIAGIQAEFYDPKTIDIETFKKNTQGQTVLIVGHSNTIPTMVNQLTGSTNYSEMGESIYNRMYIVTLAGGQAKVLSLNF